MRTHLTELFRYREAARLLTLRDLQARYSNSLLGVVWSLLYPLVLTVFFSVVFTFLAPNPIPNYPVFFLTGLLPWNFFSLAVISGTMSITGNSALVNRLRFPREILPLAVTSANAINFLIALAPLAVLMAVFRTPFTPALIWLPVIFVMQFGLTLGLVLLFAALNVYLRDVQQFMEVAMLPWFFLTPVVYQLPTEGVIPQLALWLNPMAGLVTHYRQVAYIGAAPDLGLLVVSGLEAVLALGVGLLVFRRLSRNFADEL